MAEILVVRSADELPDPKRFDYVLIERLGNGKWAANGSVTGEREVTFWRPAACASEEDALLAAAPWADANNVPTIYIRR